MTINIHKCVIKGDFFFLLFPAGAGPFPYPFIHLFPWQSWAICSRSLLMEQPGDFVDGLVCVCHTDPLSFGEGQSHCGQRL